MPGSNPVSEKERADAMKVLYSCLDVELTGKQKKQMEAAIAQALADARSEGYVAGVEDAAKVARGIRVPTVGIFQFPGEHYADAITAALLGPKKEGGG